jgi:hypothetical protein
MGRWRIIGLAGVVAVSYVSLQGVLADPQPKIRRPKVVQSIEAPFREPAELRTYRSLQKRVSAEYRNVPLTEVVSEFSARSGVNFLIDPAGLTQAGVLREMPITIIAADLRIATLLDQLLTLLGLDYAISNEIVKITSRQRANAGDLMTANYPISDLAMRIENGRNVPDAEAVKDLIATITTTIAPETWADRDGPGSAKFNDKSNTLVVRQTQQVQREVQMLLAKLRRERTFPNAGRAPSTTNLKSRGSNVETPVDIP